MLAYVTGGTGCLGRNLIDVLLQDGWDVVCLHRKSSNIAQLKDYPIRFQEVDLFDRESVHAAIPNGVDAIFHVAGNVSYWPDPEQWKDNALATRNLAHVALKRGVKKFIHTSTGATLPQQAISTPERIATIDSGYIRTKRQAEIELYDVARRGLFVVVLHPIIVIGKYDYHGHYSRLFNAKDLRLALPGALEFCDVEDVARAHVTAYHKGRRNEHYVLGGDMLTWFDFLTLVAKVTGAKPPRWVAPSWLLMIAGYIELARHYLFGHRPEITPELVRLLSTGESVQYPEKFKTQTELEYESSAEAAIRKCHAWMQAERAARDSAAAQQPAS
ncbi:MAG TPA: NAD-dependent epimerase/dehydratase family protein [Candidatus Paceibacterota bacterium]|nr:NAD-dependent epimerase/dehydratase family protein [Candidatus Paceibacterota bacterium]